MSVDPLPAKNYIRRSGVILAYARESGTTSGTPGTFREIGHISGDVQISKNKSRTTIREFGTSRTTYDLQFVDGKTGNVNFTLNLVPTDLVFQDMKADDESEDEGFLYIQAFNELGTPTGLEYKFRGNIDMSQITLPMSGLATGTLSFIINGVETFAAPTLP